jgi:crotonobetainyl-CoA:carnitine CoA-transferase CaiB-like acyl-CoA transferase
MSQVLNGIRVVEQGTFITGPCAGMMLADLGADVIKIESPDGDPYRSYQKGHYSPHFQAYNRNKRSIALDMKNGSDGRVFQRLVAEADVYIQNFRPGTAERLGAGAQQLQKLNERLVYCSISGFGSNGPYAERATYDSVAQAVSGFLSVIVDHERPRFLGPALADAITGMYAAQGILGALVERGRTNRGRLVEISMLEAMTHFAVEPFAAFFSLGQTPQSSDRPRLAQAYILRTLDGRHIAIHLSSIEKFWSNLTIALNEERLASDSRFATRQARIDNYEELGRELDRLFSRQSLEALNERLGRYDVPFAPVNRMDDVVNDPQVRHLGLIVPTNAHQGAKHTIRPAVQFDGQRAEQVTAPPLLNEHGDRIRAALLESARWPAA